jgi:hypothetical protein
MQNEDGALERCHIDHAKRSVFLANPDFPYAWADACHRLPVIGIAAFLHLKELEARSSPDRGREP